MLVKKTWSKKSSSKYYPINYYTGWFLFGIIPVYIVRNGKGWV